MDAQQEDGFNNNNNRDYDGPVPYNFEPVRQPRVAAVEVRVPRYRQEMEAWAAINHWRVGTTDWCTCGKCGPMTSALESVCCRESVPFWKLVEDLQPRPDISCLTQHPGFEGSCLNPFVLHIAYLAFRQDHGSLNLSTFDQYRYTAYRQMTRWAYGKLGRHNRKVLPACVVHAIRNQFPEESGTYRGFLWPDLDVEQE